MNRKKFFFSLTMAVLLAGCAMVTIYVTFPEEKIKKAAEDIEKMLESKNDISRIFCSVMRFVSSPAYAQESSVSSELKTDSPKIKEAIAQMKSWAEELATYKKAGYIGETLEYQVAIVNLPQDATVAKNVRELVQKENKQRNIILEEIFRLNNVAPEQRQTFKEIFARTKLKNLKPGEWFQNPDGSWSQKK
ncbi:MAG: YdbL family protein [Candidatus Omnitrophica bacterium]|nr:YdbL family protein [Candidatus Omnitrophota bacterium]MCM8824622.1 YdbL family protein [Candidatus Omnitrophota bacterium]